MERTNLRRVEYYVFFRRVMDFFLIYLIVYYIIHTFIFSVSNFVYVLIMFGNLIKYESEKCRNSEQQQLKI